MLNKVKTLTGYKLNSLDGEIGMVKEFYFDDHFWTIRYLVAETGDWLTGRQVLISPYALGFVNKEERYITIDLTKKQIEDSPSLNSDKPVSRQFERSYYEYYRSWPRYWNDPPVERDREKWRESREREEATWDSFLRSTSAVDGYHIQAADGEVGHVEDFMVDDETWAIRYLIIDTRNWWPGKKILISPKWIERVSWPESKVFIDLTCEAIKRSPEYPEESIPTRDYETRLHRHYDREGYWVDEPDAKEHSGLNATIRMKPKLKERTITMLNKAKTLTGYKLNSRDGEIGKVKEFYFDDHFWTIRYLVAETGDWLTGRQVLISPYALGFVNKEEQTITVDLTKKQIEGSPSLDSDKPVSRQFEESYYGYYRWPSYWSDDSNSWGPHPYIERDREKWKKSNPGGKAWDPHLRSTHDVDGHHIQATDGEIGHVEDFIVDDDTWAIRYLIIDTQNWWPGKKVLISPKWIEGISWPESKVFVNLARETIKQSPEYLEESLPTRDYETRLHQHYDRQGYWVDKPDAKEHSG